MKVRTILTAALAAVGGLAATSQAALVYQNTFTGGTGTPSATPGGGTLAAVNGTTTSAAFTGTGTGVDGDGGFTATNTYGTPNAGVATTASPGTSITLGTLGQFTISFWVKTAGVANDGTGVASANQFGRIFILGPSGTADQGAANSLGLEFRAGQIDVNVGGNSINSRGAVLASGVWNFVALTYDGTSASAFASTAQQAAAGNSNNAQLYEGTLAAAATQYAFGETNNSASAPAPGQFVANAGPLALGGAAALNLLNRSNDFQRGINGSIDDVRIYDSILTPAQVDAIRTSVPGATAAPEPASLAAVAVGGIALLRRRRRAAN